MLYRTEGIVLKSIEYEEADKIVTIYSKNFGKIQAIAKGVRKTKSKFGSSLEILTYAIFLIYKGSGYYKSNRNIRIFLLDEQRSG